MSETDKLQVNVYLTGKNLEMFKTLKKRFYLSTDAEVLRASLKFMYQNYDVIQALKRLGVDTTLSIEEIQTELDGLRDKLKKFDSKE